jgi:hypothetical protein
MILSNRLLKIFKPEAAKVPDVKRPYRRRLPCETPPKKIRIGKRAAWLAAKAAKDEAGVPPVSLCRPPQTARVVSWSSGSAKQPGTPDVGAPIDAEAQTTTAGGSRQAIPAVTRKRLIART